MASTSTVTLHIEQTDITIQLDALINNHIHYHITASKQENILSVHHGTLSLPSSTLSNISNIQPFNFDQHYC